MPKKRLSPPNDVDPDQADPPSTSDDLDAPDAPTTLPPAYPDIDASPAPTPLQERWPTIEDCLLEVERHAAKSHGLHGDVELLKAVAAYLRGELDLPAADDDA